MRYRFWLIANNDFIKSMGDNMTKFLLSKVRENIRNEIKKSYRVFITQCQSSGEHADNFVLNRTTFVFTGNAYRISRIIKHSLLNRITEHTRVRRNRS